MPLAVRGGAETSSAEPESSAPAGVVELDDLGGLEEAAATSASSTPAP